MIFFKYRCRGMKTLNVRYIKDLRCWRVSHWASAEHVSEAENGAERAENRVERSKAERRVERAWQKTMERERSGRSRSGNGAGSGGYRNR